MINLGLLRNDPEKLRLSEKTRFAPKERLDSVIDLDSRWRESNSKLEKIREKVNVLSLNADSALKHKDELSKLKKEVQSLEELTSKLSQERNRLAGFIGNVVSQDVPAGNDEKSNLVIKKVAGIKAEGQLSHEQLMDNQGGLDLAAASKYSGSRFRYLLGEVAQKHRLLQELAIDFAQTKGFLLVIPPMIAQSQTLEATGFFPSGEDDTYRLDTGQYLAGTSEPMLLALGADRKFKSSELPKRFVGFSTCFRKEAGSYGKDTKGMFRLHQFDKVEMVSIVEPEHSEQELAYLISIQEEFISKFNLTFQQVLLCGGEQSLIASKHIDHEIWFPSQSRYRETHSASNCTDFQSRELKMKVVNNESVDFAHTLNATLATERLLLAIVENYQTKDGKISWPEKLK